MSQIEVPDWVVEIAAKAYFEDMCSLDRWNDPMDEAERDDWRDGARKIITAALGAWVVPAGFTNSEEMRELLAGRGGWVSGIELDGDTHTLYTLRQEKPE